MDHPSERGLTLSVTWSSAAKKRAFELPLGLLLRAAVVVALCAVSFQFGVWRARLEQQASTAVASVAPLARMEPLSEQQIGAGAPGAPAGQSQDVITPLNVRDPSALVMGPSVAGEQQAAVSPEVPPAPRRRRR